MNMRSFKTGATLMVAAMVGFSGTASALSLNTQALQATSTLQFSSEAYGVASMVGISFGAWGNTYQSGSKTTPDGVTVPTFVLPVTNADVSLGWNLKLSPESGEAIGSGLMLSRGNRQLGLANFSIDYKTDKVYADVIANGKSTNMAVYSFTEMSDLQIGLKGLALTLNQTLGSLKLTTQATDTFASVLGLDSFIRGAMGVIDFGTITIDIKTALRMPISDNPLTAASMVPEASTYVMMGIGLAGIALISRRRPRQG